MASIKDQIIEAIVTHPEDTITIPDIEAQFDGKLNIHTIRVCVSRDLAREGYVKKTKKQGFFMVYKILKRGVEKVPVIPAPESNGLNYEQIGMAMVRHIKNLEEKVKEFAESYSSLQSHLNKVEASNRLYMKNRDNEINDLKKQINILRDRLKSKETKFPMSELIGR